ncbi:MAG: FAD-binding oxidoreductase [Methanomassiliicoccales archaeon]|nr:FAD-binding oxidoreductase [Methanomassiliicoccales archaeon]
MKQSDQQATNVLRDEKTLERFSRDMSGYRIRPKCVALPANESELRRLAEVVSDRGIVITARGGGSNQSGSAVGGGLILATTKLNEILNVDRDRARVQSGVWHGDLMRRALEIGSMVPYDPSSSTFCTIGGNVATNATGLRGVKYGSVDRWLSSVRLFNPRFGILDSRDTLPRELEQGLLRIKEELLGEAEILALQKKRKGVKSSSGYNLSSFLDYDEPRKMLAHLMAGSAGTLGVLTEVEMKLIPAPTRRTLFLVPCNGVKEACALVPDILRFKPSSLELMDSYGTEELRKTGWNLLKEENASLITEFDEDAVRTGEVFTEFLVGKGLRPLRVEEPERQAALWKMRGGMLLRIKKAHEDAKHRFIPFADDLAVPVPQLSAFVEDIRHLFEEEGLTVVIYGHVGEGNVHVRPLIPSDDWQERLRRLAEECFRITFKYGGSMTGEHGMGRNRAPFLLQEFGKRTYEAFREVKELFDPMDLLNRGTMFSAGDMTEGLSFDE